MFTRMDFQDLKTKNHTELTELLGKEEVLLHTAKAKAKTRQLKQVHTVAVHRQTIARIKTVLHTKPAK